MLDLPLNGLFSLHKLDYRVAQSQIARYPEVYNANGTEVSSAYYTHLTREFLEPEMAYARA
jgi:hypothetical protein